MWILIVESYDGYLTFIYIYNYILLLFMLLILIYCGVVEIPKSCVESRRRLSFKCSRATFCSRFKRSGYGDMNL